MQCPKNIKSWLGQSEGTLEVFLHKSPQGTSPDRVAYVVRKCAQTDVTKLLALSSYVTTKGNRSLAIDMFSLSQDADTGLTVVSKWPQARVSGLARRRHFDHVVFDFHSPLSVPMERRVVSCQDLTRVLRTFLGEDRLALETSLLDCKIRLGDRVAMDLTNWGREQAEQWVGDRPGAGVKVNDVLFNSTAGIVRMWGGTDQGTTRWFRGVGGVGAMVELRAVMCVARGHRIRVLKGYVATDHGQIPFLAQCHRDEGGVRVFHESGCGNEISCVYMTLSNTTVMSDDCAWARAAPDETRWQPKTSMPLGLSDWMAQDGACLPAWVREWMHKDVVLARELHPDWVHGGRVESDWTRASALQQMISSMDPPQHTSAPRIKELAGSEEESSKRSRCHHPSIDNAPGPRPKRPRPSPPQTTPSHDLEQLAASMSAGASVVIHARDQISALEGEVESLRRQLDAVMVSLNDSGEVHSRELEEVRQAHSRELEEVRQAHSRELEEVEQAHSHAVDELEQVHILKIEDQKLTIGDLTRRNKSLEDRIQEFQKHRERIMAAFGAMDVGQ